MLLSADFPASHLEMPIRVIAIKAAALMQTLCAFLCMLPLHLELFPSPWNYFWLDTYRCVAVFFLVISVTPLIFTWQFSRRAVEIQLCWHSSVLLWLDCKQDPVFCSQSRWWEILKIEKKFHAMNDRDLIFGLKSQKSGHCLLKDTFLLIMVPISSTMGE